MSTICPTITAENIDDYSQQIKNVQGFAKRLHIDLMDGVFTDNKSVGLSQAYWPDNIVADIHLMYQRPADYLDQLIKLKPSMVVIHAESDCDVAQFAMELQKVGIKTGLALLTQTSVESVKDILQYVQQVLIFSGNLGYQGGSQVDFDLLKKIEQVKLVKSDIQEIAWDGGIKDQNVEQIANAGVDVINVGGYIQKAENPEAAFTTLANLLG